jgi:small conductance mechanosensitive channel
MSKELANITKYYEIIMAFFINYSFQILGAVIVAFVGVYLAKKVASYVEKFCIVKNIDVTLTQFISATIKTIIIVGTLIIAIGKIGVTITPFIAVIGAMTLSVGLALRGMLSNFGAGIMIIATRPFIVGNTISIKNISGVVKIIKLGYTVLITEDNEEITIPNKHIVGEILINSFEYKIVEMTMGIDYDINIEKAMKIILNILLNNNEISKNKKAQVGIKKFTNLSINIELRYWVPTIKYNEIQYEINLAIFNALKQNNITIPYPTYNIIQKDTK